ncbi:unnamed protein product [Moneuplotes crassus]|uniref:Cyclic nucleotide-binding domain-containing protein n=1 Tax=Euplotes crassus TaxID=5936 RepID=A0AAD2D431_EUPCR|nr:unnamed protein product [Moneuplotes crassus]
MNQVPNTQKRKSKINQMRENNLKNFLKNNFKTTRKAKDLERNLGYNTIDTKMNFENAGYTKMYRGLINIKEKRMSHTNSVKQLDETKESFPVIQIGTRNPAQDRFINEHLNNHKLKKMSTLSNMLVRKEETLDGNWTMKEKKFQNQRKRLLSKPSDSMPFDLNHYIKHFANINTKMDKVFVKNIKRKSKAVSQPRLNTENIQLVSPKFHIPSGLKSRRQIFNEFYESRKSNSNYRAKYLRKFNNYAIGDKDSATESNESSITNPELSMAKMSSSLNISRKSSGKSLVSNESMSSQSRKSMYSKKGHKQKSRFNRKKFKKPEEEKSLKDNPNFFEISNGGIKQLKLYEKSKINGRTPFEICYNRTQMAGSEGNIDENLYIADYLINNIDFFKMKQIDIMPYIARKLKAIRYNPGDVIIRKGDDGDCMYILYKGKIKIIWGDESKGQFVEKDSGFSFGADALLDDAKRSATVVATSVCDTLVVLKTDFNKCIKDTEKLQKLETFKYLKEMDFFKKWTFEDLLLFNEKLKPLQYKPDQKVYVQGENTNMIYIVFKGTLVMQSDLDLDLFYKYPGGKNKWMVTKMTRRVRSKIKELHDGDIFGHEDFILGTMRSSTVYSKHESKVFYCKTDDNDKILSKEKFNQMKNVFPPVNFQKIGQSIIESFDMIKKYSNSFLSGININYIPDSSRDNFHGDTRLKKLRPWMDRAKNSKNSISGSLVEMKNNNTILYTKYSYFEVERDSVFTPVITVVGIPSKKKDEDGEDQQ